MVDYIIVSLPALMKAMFRELNKSRLCLALLLSSLESTIVSTALVSIGSEFHNLEQSNWIIISYLLTYSSKSRALGALKTFYKAPR